MHGMASSFSSCEAGYSTAHLPATEPFNVNRSDVIWRYVPTHARGHWLSSFVILNEGKDLLELQDSSLRSE
jgi:hypothetical protein